MSNYSRTTNFTAKDGLATGNPAKLIKGSDFQLEFDNVASASSTKADLASPTFTGTVTIPTANVTTSFTANGLTYPAADGSSGQVLSTDGAGNLSFTSSSGFDSTTNAIALGNAALAFGTYAVSIGTNSDASQLYSVALGYGAQATGTDYDVAIGKDATTVGALGAGNVALGHSSAATGAYGISVGYDATASGAQGLAVGYIAQATGTDSIAIGRQLTTSGQQAIGIGYSAQAGNTGGISIGHSAISTQPDAVLLGRSTTSLGTGGVAVGATANTSGTYSVAVGFGAGATNTSSVAIGYNSSATASYGTAVGREAEANTGSYNTALGYRATAATYATAVNQATASGARSVAIGHSATASAPDSVAIGYQSSAIGTDAVGIGNLAGADAANAIHINASGVITNQPQGNGNIVIESSTAKLAYDGNWDLSTGNLAVNGDVSATGGLSGTGLTLGGTAVTSTAAELNKLDGVTATATELNYVAGATSSLQTQINAKAPTDNPTFTTDVTVPQLSLGNWTLELSTNDLVFKYSGVAKFKLATTGELTAVDDVTAFGTI